MVSPGSSASASLPLSYAERAKKAQNARSLPQQPPQRGTSTTTSATASSPHSVPPTASKFSPSGAVGADPRISSAATHWPPPASSKPSTAASADNAPDPKLNGDVNNLGDDSASLATPAITSQKQAAAPPLNVWKIRKEQMAQRVLTQSHVPQPLTLSASQTSGSALSPPPPSGLETSRAPSANTSTYANMSSSTGPLHPNGHLAPPAEHDDPFVVKPGRSVSSITASLNGSPSSVNTSLNPSPPATNDMENWPEVGQAAVPPPNANNGKHREDEDKGHEREASQGHGSRKGEKTKWKPVPPEDLHFEGPARPQHHASTRQRSHHDRNNQRQPGVSSGGASTSSGQGSQQQSRTQSAAGRRHTPSHAGSVSHSQVQSRAGSVHSSPRHPSVRGAGGRLPDETIGPVFGTSRRSETNSPSTYAQPRPLPAQEFIPGVRSYVNTSVTQSRDSTTLSAIASATESNVHSAYYPSHLHHLGVSPYHSPLPSGSPANNPYSLPPMVYPGQPGIPMSGYSTPPYMYPPPYGYPYGQPYMYWQTSGVPHTAPSPVTNPQPNDGMPPPTMLVRPPPPNQSDAVAGYRDIGFVIPPPVEYNQREEPEDRGTLSFGSINAGISKSPSPAPASPGLVAVPEGAALGLDVNGGQPPLQTITLRTQSENNEETKDDDSKASAVFSIGVAPGESPARLRPRTRTQSKGAATVAGHYESSSKDSDQSGTSAMDPVEVLAVSAAKVMDLTNAESKWEFGTTKLVDKAGEGSDEPAVHSNNSLTKTGLVNPSATVTAPINIHAANFVPMASQYAGIAPYPPPVAVPAGPINGLPSAPSPSTYPPRPTLSAGEEDWAVRDYGFKREGPGPVYSQVPAAPREDRPSRGGRDYQQPGDRESHYGRPRRGSYSQGGYGYDRGGERGSFGGRRGRGLSGGYGGRGYQNRWHNARGGYAGQNHQRHQQPPLQQEATAYFAPPNGPLVNTLATYIPQAFEGYTYAPYPPPPPQTQTAGAALPLPIPQSNVGFPLDSTRYYLLGQLEYYLSAQNLAKDLYLREKMDSRGWIPISLIASFNRVRTLTLDPQLVAEVLSLSSLVEVSEQHEHVRMRQWQLFVLPTAEPSRVEDDGPQQASPSAQYNPPQGQIIDQQLSSQNDEGEDDEEEDVEFVM